MLRRKIAFPLAVFAATVGVMALQKPLFMAWYAGEAAATGAEWRGGGRGPPPPR